MKLYCHIEKQEGTETFVIKEGPCELPQSSSRISNLNVLDNNALKMFGWVPVEQITENKPIFVSASYKIYEDRVIETTITRDKTEEELVTQKNKEDYYTWQMVRDKRNRALGESDKLVMIDRWETLSYEEKDRISEYRRQLRDLPAQNSDPNLIIFPVL